MKHKRIKKIVVVESHDGQEFAELYNKAMLDLAEKNPEELIRTETNGHCAYIRYEEVERIPENAADEYRLRGIFIRCGQCPFYLKAADGRVKYCTCSMVGYKVGERDDACNFLYQEIAKGAITIDGVPKDCKDKID